MVACWLGAAAAGIAFVHCRCLRACVIVRCVVCALFGVRQLLRTDLRRHRDLGGDGDDGDEDLSLIHI